MFNNQYALDSNASVIDGIVSIKQPHHSEITPITVKYNKTDVGTPKNPRPP